MSIPAKLDNAQAEYFQIALFLITERLKGEKSSWKPFLDYLPASNETLFTIKDQHPISPSVNVSLYSEIQRPDDDIFNKIQYDRNINIDCEQRFRKFVNNHFSVLQEWLKEGEVFVNTEDDIMQYWDWAWMNLATRCFGHFHLPNEIAMVPLLDLVNHTEEQANVRFFLLPFSLNKQMLQIDIDKQTTQELEKDAYESLFIGHRYEDEDGKLCQDLNQHIDYYPDKYYNYRAFPITDKQSYPPRESS